MPSYGSQDVLIFLLLSNHGELSSAHTTRPDRYSDIFFEIEDPDRLTRMTRERLPTGAVHRPDDGRDRLGTVLDANNAAIIVTVIEDRSLQPEIAISTTGCTGFHDALPTASSRSVGTGAKFDAY